MTDTDKPAAPTLADVRARTKEALAHKLTMTREERCAEIVDALGGPLASLIGGWIETEADALDRDLKSGQAETLRALAASLEAAAAKVLDT